MGHPPGSPVPYPVCLQPHFFLPPPPSLFFLFLTRGVGREGVGGNGQSQIGDSTDRVLVGLGSSYGPNLDLSDGGGTTGGVP